MVHYQVLKSIKKHNWKKNHICEVKYNYCCVLLETSEWYKHTTTKFHVEKKIEFLSIIFSSNK